MVRRILSGLGASIAAGALLATSAGAASGPPPPPKSTNGKPVQQVGAGLQTPTSFAFGAGQVFVSDFGSETGGTGPGGVFVLKNGTATRLPGSPPVSFGLAWRKGTLYVSAGSQLMAWSGWDGTKFASQKVIYTAPKGFPGFNGIGFGANGRLYAGVSLASNNDHSPSKAPFAFDILSFNASGKNLKVVARGIRQPWQMVFPAGSSSPIVSGLGQDTGAKNPPDFLFRVLAGQNYGFPKCNWTVLSACSSYATPFKFFGPHFDAMGLGIIGSRLYISSFTNPTGKGPGGEVLSMPLIGGPAKPLLTGFVAPVVALGVHAGWVYVGEVGTGLVFRVKH
jgi:hypothetical protein